MQRTIESWSHLVTTIVDGLAVATALHLQVAVLQAAALQAVNLTTVLQTTVHLAATLQAANLLQRKTR
jgi:hypothetical protein